MIDGNNKTISHMLIKDTTLLYRGFVGVLYSSYTDGDGAVIKDLGIEAGKIEINNQRATNNGGVTGGVSGAGKKQILRCWNGTDIIGPVVSTSPYSRSGGICGIAASTSAEGWGTLTIDGCYNTGKINSTTSGGIMAQNGFGRNAIINCYNTGRITGTSMAGGIVGYSNPGNFDGQSIIGCYNLGECTGRSSGGIFGYMESSTVIRGCFYNSVNGPGGSSAGVPSNGIGITPAKMKQWAAAFTLNKYGLESESKESSWTWTEGGMPTLYNPAVNPEKKLAPAKDWSCLLYTSRCV